MNFWRRALCYVKRRKVKSVLLILTFFLIGNLVILGLGISQASDNAKILTRKQMRAVVSYEVDWDSYYNYVDNLTDEDEQNEAYQNSPKIDAATAEKLAEDSRVRALNYMNTTQAYSVGFDNVPVGNEQDRGTSTMMDDSGNEMEYKEPNLMIYGIGYPNMIEMAEGTWTIEDGAFPTQSQIDNGENVAAITKELADQNGLHVGDTITIQFLDYYTQVQMQNAGMDTSDTQTQLTICGIYNTKSEVDPNSDNYKWMSAYESPKNIIVMPLETMGRAEYASSQAQTEYYQQQDPSSDYGTMPSYEESGYGDPGKVVYLLDDPLETDQFVSDHSADLAQYTKLDANNDAFKKMARPLDTLSFFANIIVAIVIVNAVVIISLVAALSLKTREYEIGVMLSLGVSKLKVVAQLFIELMITALIGFGLASVSGSMLAGRVGEMALDYQTTTDAQYEDNSDDNSYYWSSDQDYFTEVSQDQLLDQYHVQVSPALIAEIFGIGAVVVLIAIVIPSFMIMRLNPKQILLEQN